MENPRVEERHMTQTQFCGRTGFTRRDAVAAGLIGTLLSWTSETTWANNGRATALPQEVAGIRLPSTSFARKAAALSRTASPEFLFNHSMRSYLFGTIYAGKHGVHYDSEAAFVAAALHDLGLLPAFASADLSFEVDGANNAEAFLHREGAPVSESSAVWNAVALHATRPQFTSHQAGEVLVLSAGVGSDFAGVDPSEIDPKQEQEILAAFPRLQFKKRFLDLLTDHCRRKPLSQRATWLGDLCHAQVPRAPYPNIARALMQAPFPE